MSTLPGRKDLWKKEALRNNISHTQSLTAGPTLVSGSKFEFEHFLRLRVLYKQERTLKTLARSLGFLVVRLEELEIIFREDTDVAFVKTLL